MTISALRQAIVSLKSARVWAVRACNDNACMESSFSTLKKNIIYGKKFKTWEEAKQLIVEYIETFYNCRRLQSSLGNISPIVYK